MAPRPTHGLFILALLGASLTLAFTTMPDADSFASMIRRSGQAAAVFFVESISASEIRNDYRLALATTTSAVAPKRVKVLIVPGHQPAIGGAEFGGALERDIVVDIADDLAAELQQDARFDVTVARGKTSWNPALEDYFDTHAADIEAFRESQAMQMAGHLIDGTVSVEPNQVDHVAASTSAALQLYGINKWASDNRYDITIHLHLNDYSGRAGRNPGRYDGFAVYIPDRQYSNAHASAALGQAIAWRLSALHATSTMPGETAGLVEDQSLIAIGSNNSADDAALLIEYGYIYEPQFLEPTTLPLAEADYAHETYLGIRDFLEDPVQGASASLASLEEASSVTGKAGERGASVYALQASLMALGFYPPSGQTLEACPVSGVAGSCTEEAIRGYQAANGLETTGSIGPLTRAALASDLSNRISSN